MKRTRRKTKKKARTKNLYRTKKYRDWRTKIFRRDRYTCQMCNKIGGYIEAHHIKLKSVYPELIFTTSNGITLCGRCHKDIHSDDMHKVLQSYFKELAKENKPRPRMVRARRRSK